MGSGYGGNGFGVVGGVGFGLLGLSLRSNSNGKGKVFVELLYWMNNFNLVYGFLVSMVGLLRLNMGIFV